jgi:hypothetical protein
MGSLSPSTWGKGLLNAISTPRGQTPSPQTPSPQEAPRESSKTNKALGRAAIAAAIGAGMSVFHTGSKEMGLSVAERAVHAATSAATFAGAAGTFTAAEGSVLTRALKGAGVGLLAGASVNKVGNLSGVDALPKLLAQRTNQNNPIFGERARPFV